MSTGLRTNTENRPIINAPQSVIISEYLPDIDDASTRATAVAQVGDSWSSLPEGTQYRQSAFFSRSVWQGQLFRPDCLKDSPSQQPSRWSLARTQYSGVVNNYFPDDHPYFTRLARTEPD